MKIFKITLQIFLSLIGAALLISVSRAEIFKWIDENGVIHFTDNKSNVPKEILDKLETINLPDKKRESEIDIDNLSDISFKKNETGFDGTLFDTTFDDFIKENEKTKLNSNKGKEKTVSIGNGMRRIGNVRVSVLYSFYDELFHMVEIRFDDKDEKEFIRKIKGIYGKPDFERYPFLYWFYDDIELKLRKDSDIFFIAKKKIKNF